MGAPLHSARGDAADARSAGSPGSAAATGVDLHTYEVVTNSITDLVSVADETGVYRMVNDAWCRATGLAREHAVGSSVYTTLASGVTEPRIRALRECIEQREIRRVRDQLPIPGLAGRWIETTYFPFVERMQGLRCAVMITRDVSDEERAREDLAHSAQLLAMTLNATDEGIFASDAANPDEPVRFVNRRLLQIWGFAPEKAERLTPAEIIEQARPLFVDAEAEIARITDIIAHNRNDEQRLHLRDGRIVLRRRIAARHGERALRVWSFRDVTAEERAMQAMRAGQAELRSVLDAFPGFIAAIDQDHRYTYVNAPLGQVIGVAPAELIGRHVRDVLGEARYAELLPLMARSRGGETPVVERHYPELPGRPRRDLELRYVASPAQPDGRCTYYVFGTDITQRKMAEEALTAAKDDAERANRAKSRFMSLMSHELRTPLNAILGFGQLLQIDRLGTLLPEQQQQVDEILRGGRHLLRLINDVLDLGRIETGRLSFDLAPVPLQPLMAECLALMEPLARERGVTLDPLPSPSTSSSVIADRMRLKQVLLNLLGNAIKYNRANGHVRLSVRHDADLRELSVHDTGPGLDEQQQQRLFTAFERLGAAGGPVEGTGIGLALSRRLVQAMQGEIGVESQPGAGSRFWIRLPAADGSARAASALPHRPPEGVGAPSAPPLRVLYIEDNEVNALLMRAMLERLPGLVYEHTARPLDGLARAVDDPPALVLLDIQLPGIDGFEVLRRLREHPRTRVLPVVAVSASAMPDDIQAGLEAGFDDYLTKPLEIGTLHAAVLRLARGPTQAG